MRLPGSLLITLLLIVDTTSSQNIDVPSPSASNLPMFRPALLGRGPTSLVNTIDTQDLIKKGQKNAAIMFYCLVANTGDIFLSGTYRGTPSSKLLEEEVLKHLANAKFIPAIHNRQPITVFFYGTVVFAVVDGKPRLRIFSNQQLEELKKESDFIGPQPYVGADSKFDGVHYPETGSPVLVSGAAELALNVDAEGNLKDVRLVSEYPPLLGFGDAAVSAFKKAKFIPAFRDGQPVESKVTLPIYFTPSK
jgi:TonB family protein